MPHQCRFCSTMEGVVHFIEISVGDIKRIVYLCGNCYQQFFVSQLCLCAKCHNIWLDKTMVSSELLITNLCEACERWWSNVKTGEKS